LAFLAAAKLTKYVKARKFKNPKTGAAMAFFSALCFFGASIFTAKSGNQIWAASLSIGTLYVILGTIILNKGRQD